MGKKKINNKGFTLVELLAIIAITGLVLGIGIYSVVNLVKGSKNKATLISEASVKESASIYSSEVSSSSWIYPNNGDYEYYCVTIEELINKGIIANNATLPEGIGKTNYVVIKRNRVTFVKGEAVVLKDATEYPTEFQVCTGNDFKEEVTAPSKGDYSSYTDMLSIEYKDGTAESDITDKWCQYDVSSSIEPITDIEYGKNVVKISEDNKCNIDGLKDDTTYYVRVCMATERGSRVCSDTKDYNTSKFKDPSYSVSGNGIKIKYDDTGVRDPEHYFKSNTDGTGNVNVSLCDDDFVCSGSTTDIEKDKWYKVENSEVIISYDNSSSISDGVINARIEDESGNFKENSKEFRLYNVLFEVGDADKIDSGTSNITKKCLAFRGDSCSVKSPSITKSCYQVKGWNTNKSASNAIFSAGSTIAISSNSTYYPIIGDISSYTIKYNYNYNGTVTSQTCTCGTSVSLKNKITRTGYTHNKWNTNSSGTGSSYTPGGYYSCGNYYLYAIWDINKYTLSISKGTGVNTIYYKVNGASSYTASTSNVSTSVNYGSKYYYYGTANTGYTMSSCTSSSPCSGTMGTSDLNKSLSAKLNQYTLSISKGTGVNTIYYKVNGASSYTSSVSNVSVSVNYGSKYYYYGTANTGYTMSSCTSSSPCSGTMGTSDVSKSLSAKLNQYTLSISKGTGVSTIYYKVNGASSYTSSTSKVSTSVNYGSKYYYYGTASSGYTMNSCTSSSPCSGTMGTSAVSKTLSATATSTPINGYRCDGTNSYYITTCTTSGTCSYTDKNGSSSTGTVSQSSLKYCPPTIKITKKDKVTTEYWKVEYSVESSGSDLNMVCRMHNDSTSTKGYDDFLNFIINVHNTYGNKEQCYGTETGYKTSCGYAQGGSYLYPNSWSSSGFTCASNWKSSAKYIYICAKNGSGTYCISLNGNNMTQNVEYTCRFGTGKCCSSSNSCLVSVSS